MVYDVTKLNRQRGKYDVIEHEIILIYFNENMDIFCVYSTFDWIAKAKYGANFMNK